VTGQGVVLFHTSAAALRAEAVVQRAGFAVRLIPTPRQLSSDCGVALRFDWEAHDGVLEALTAWCIATAGVHRLT
jgi:hypothetical protein